MCLRTRRATLTLAAEQQYYVYLYCRRHMAALVKNYAPAALFDYGNRAAALWLDR
jgi:hypothetical protein